MPVDEALRDKVAEFLRVDGVGDANVLDPLILGAQQYLTNAGVVAPAEEATEAELALYELAVTLYVNTIYHGGSEGSLERAMHAIILQIRTYGGESS